MNTDTERPSAPTGAQDSETEQEADRPLGGAACSPSPIWSELFAKTEDGNASILMSHKVEWASERQEYPPATELEFVHLLESDPELRRRMAKTSSNLQELNLLLDLWKSFGRPHPVVLRHDTLSGRRTDCEHLAASFGRLWLEFLGERPSAPTGASTSEKQEPADRPLGGA